MKNKPKLGFLLFTAVIVFSIMACGGTAPTATLPPPPPTNTPPPPPPTNTPPPPPTATLPPPPEPTATQPTTGGPSNIVAGQINILEVNGYLDSYGDWNIVGLVSNNTERFVNDIEIEVEIFDASNNSIFKDTTWTDLYTLAPGEVTPFELYVYDDLPNADHFVATVVGNGTTSDVTRANVEVTQSNLWLDEYNDLYLVGTLTNNSDQVASISDLAAALFDSNGALVTAGSSSVSVRYLEPGESGPFRINLSPPEDLAASLTDYRFYIDAQVYSETDKYELTFSDHYDYLDAYGNFHLVGQITNNSTTSLNISLLAALYDDNGNVVDASSISLPISSLAPGETIPYDFDSWGPVNYAAGAYDVATKYEVFVDWYWTWDTTTELVDLTTSNDANTFDNYQAKFTGKIVNNTNAELESATIIIALYDKASGELIATDWDWIFDTIPVGASADYEVYISIPDGLTANQVEYEIIVKGEK